MRNLRELGDEHYGDYPAANNTARPARGATASQATRTSARQTRRDYIGMATFIRTTIPWFDVRIAPLQARNTMELKAARESQEIVPGKGSKQQRKKLTSKKKVIPTKEEKESFEDMQSFMCEQLLLYHMDPERTLFLKVDAMSSSRNKATDDRS